MSGWRLSLEVNRLEHEGERPLRLHYEYIVLEAEGKDEAGASEREEHVSEGEATDGLLGLEAAEAMLHYGWLHYRWSYW